MAIKRTMKVAHICRGLGNPDVDLMAEFEYWAIPEVREACIVRMYDWLVTEEIANWAEKTITELLQLSDDMGEELLEWYLFHNKSASGNIKREDYEKYVSRALKFVIDLEHKIPKFLFSKVSKIIAGVLLQRGNNPMFLYNQLPFLKDFLKKSLGKLQSERWRYGKQEWIFVERALKIIHGAQDISFIDTLEQMLASMKKGTIKIDPDDREFPFYEEKCHEAAIAELIAVLKGAAKETK